VLTTPHNPAAVESATRLDSIYGQSPFTGANAPRRQANIRWAKPALVADWIGLIYFA